jgi:hypothetical protein
MKFTQFLGPAAALFAAVSAEVVTVTTVVDEYTTYCPVSLPMPSAWTQL